MLSRYGGLQFRIYHARCFMCYRCVVEHMTTEDQKRALMPSLRSAPSMTAAAKNVFAQIDRMNEDASSIGRNVVTNIASNRNDAPQHNQATPSTVWAEEHQHLVGTNREDRVRQGSLSAPLQPTGGHAMDPGRAARLQQVAHVPRSAPQTATILTPPPTHPCESTDV